MIIPLKKSTPQFYKRQTEAISVHMSDFEKAGHLSLADY
jgi:hypothetical protein